MRLEKSKLNKLLIPLLSLYIAVTWPMSFAKAVNESRGKLEASQFADEETAGQLSLPAGIQIVKDISYADDPLQRFDIFIPRSVKKAPVILMVHGGGWAKGDKSARSVVENKVTRWVPKGFIFISVNYRLLPKATPIQQADDIAKAIAIAQQKAAYWGGDRDQFILMGHSAGAHLVTLLAASPTLYSKYGASPALSVISLDSAALNVPGIMEGRHLRLYDRAFGKDRQSWQQVSPLHMLAGVTPPFLAVCSSRRENSCIHAKEFVTKANNLGSRASILEQDLSHREINQQLGTKGHYTHAVESFMRTLNVSIEKMLTTSN